MYRTALDILERISFIFRCSGATKNVRGCHCVFICLGVILVVLVYWASLNALRYLKGFWYTVFLNARE